MIGLLESWRHRAAWSSALALPLVLAANIWFVAAARDVAAPVGPRHVATTSEPTVPAPEEAPTLDVTAQLAIAPPPPPMPVPTDRPPRIAFFGDSVAWSTASALAAAAGPDEVEIVNAGIWGCGAVRGTPFRYFGATYDVLPNDCDHWPTEWQAAVDRGQPDVAVVMVGRWELMDRVHDGVWTHIGDVAFDRYLGSELDLAIAVAGSRGARVVVATTPYYRRGDAPGGGTWPEDEPDRVDQVNVVLRGAALRNRVGVVEYGALLSPQGALAMEIGGVRVRSDGVHIASSAGPWLAPRLLPAIRRAAGI